MIRVGIISPSEIAFRRFLPALTKLNDFKFMGVAISSESEWTGNDYSYSTERNKANSFIEHYGGKIFDGYESMINSKELDAIYLPLPPALHYRWAKLILLSNKHVMVEKPATTSMTECEELIAIAKQNKLAIHENYMFIYHSQINQIKEIVSNKEIGEVRLYRISFGFPRRLESDFRYCKDLGGGALLDCGGYTLKYATFLLGNNIRLACAQSNFLDEFEVDIYGSSTLVDESGTTVQISFGMDNAYKCELEVWGSRGTLYTNRILTAPVGFEPELFINIGSEREIRKLNEDDSFMKSIMNFKNCIENNYVRENNYSSILMQSKLVDNFIQIIRNN
jgi:dTDP-3,4-didehydro-2,6-dideoxy-alpha-D-glucose 3-reductase